MRSRILIARDTLSVSCSHPDAAVDPSESACPPKLRTLSSLFPVPSRLLLLLPPVDAVEVACGCPASSEETLRRRLLCAAATPAIGCRNGLYMYQSPRRRISRARMQHIMRGRYLARVHTRGCRNDGAGRTPTDDTAREMMRKKLESGLWAQPDGPSRAHSDF